MLEIFINWVFKTVLESKDHYVLSLRLIFTKSNLLVILLIIVIKENMKKVLITGISSRRILICLLKD